MTVDLHAHPLPNINGGRFARVLLPHVSRWCDKVEYDDEAAARAALFRLWTGRVRLGRVKREVGLYRCPLCRAWHLTSQAQR